MKQIFRFKELLSIILVVLSYATYDNRVISLLKLNFLSKDYVEKSSILNIIILLIGVAAMSTFDNNFYLIPKKNGLYDADGRKDLLKISSILKVDLDKAKYFVERTSATVGQLCKNFSLFLWPLIIFYCLSIVKNRMNFHIPDEFKAVDSYTKFIENYPSNGLLNHKVFWFIVLSALANIFNFLSGVGLFVSFSILYHKTLDAENKSTLHFGPYYFLFVTYILAYVLFLGYGFGPNFPLKNSLILLDLFCSFFNCFGMILFFNRLVQILYFYQSELKRNIADKIYMISATFVFPIYASAQMFFVVFDVIPDDWKKEIQGFVFFICFVGKCFLILFLFTFIQSRWMHAVILTLLRVENVPLQMAMDVKSIFNSINDLDTDLNSVQGRTDESSRDKGKDVDKGKEKDEDKNEDKDVDKDDDESEEKDQS